MYYKAQLKLFLLSSIIIIGTLCLSLFGDNSTAVAKATTNPPTDHDQPQPQFAKVSVSGQNLTLAGEVLRLKGHSFYPYQTPWAAMWDNWNGPEVQAQVGQAAMLGDNVLRVLVPYGTGYNWNLDASGLVNPVYLNELRQMVQIAGTFKMKVILTLFEYTPLSSNGTEILVLNICSNFFSWIFIEQICF